MKLGGSVITDKARYRTPRLDALGRLAHELRMAPSPLVVVHGAGSYGHIVAKTHGLAAGGGTPEDVAQVHADVRELGGLVLVALQQARIPAVWISPFDCAGLRDGELAGMDATPTRAALDAGLAPVLGGDVVIDARRKWGILSGDVIMAHLAKELKPDRAVFATDVDGIFDRWPGGTLLDRVPRDATIGGEGMHADVTGAMAGKLARAREVAKHAPTHVVNGNAPGRLADLLSGKAAVGTIVE